ncbi:glycogen synthase GlgA [Atopobium sp. oral taxon 416]|nr:glycogen synthase GlgA [Atopobium sp. oral taxon 416]
MEDKMGDSRQLNVLFASSEVVPFVKTGGLADVAGSLPRALKDAGCNVSVIMPKYSRIPDEYKYNMQHICEFYVPLSWRNVWCGIDKLAYNGVDIYFVDNEGYFKRDGIYGYFDDGERFAFFSKAILECLQYVPELNNIDILHCNDWQTALAPVFLCEFYHGVGNYDNIKTVFTVHNAKFQGQFSNRMLNDVLGLGGIPAAADQLYCDRDSINFMKGALCYADRLTTVSPTYACELQMPFYGEGLDGIFRRRSNVLSGILNGIDTQAWNPSSDSQIAAYYSIYDMSGKAECKRALQEELGLRQDPLRPLVAMVGRLTEQKGIGLVRYAMDYLMSRSVQIAVLGTGDKDLEDSFKYFDWKYGDMMSARITFDSALSHRMYAGADLFLMPSEFEPCGLSQMIAMRYGTLPVVRETGGLKDTVKPYNKYTGEGTGFSFANINGDEMVGALMDACEVFWTDQDAWKKLQYQAMTQDFSWRRAANDYVGLYHSLHPEV